jgi:choline-sulfatase
VARPFRFTFILLLAALATGLSAAGGWRFARASAPVNGPIILISIDTLRSDHLPAYGYRKVRTPAIDSLAADGTLFERAYSHAPQTLPAHASILSGRLPFETGVRDNVGFVVKQGERLLPQMLRDRGYSTAGVVSSYVLRKETRIDQGFEFFDGDMPPPAEGASIGRLQRDGAESEAIAERWLDQQRSQRVFLFLHLYEPHKPYAPPPQYAEYSPYDGEIAYADELVGRLIHYLKSHQLYDRSTIVLLSDHGEGLGDHGEQEHGLFLYDEAIHVPLIIKQAGGAGAGRRVTDVVQHIDVAPTILDLAKAPIPGNLHGRSLKLLLDGNGPPRGVSVYSEALYGRYHFGWSELIAVTDDRFRYIRAPREELYDLRPDPKEKVDVGPDRVEARRAFREALGRMTGGATIPPSGLVSDQDRQRLEALGYVGAYVESATEPAEAAAIDPKDQLHVVEAYRRAVELVASDRLTPAIDILQRLTHDNPSLADVWRQLGHVLMFAGRLDQAAHAYERSAALTPRDTSALIGAATALYRLGRLDEAQRDAETALSVAHDLSGRSLVVAEEVIAKVAIARKNFDEAREYAAAGQGADPPTPLVDYIDGLIEYHQSHYDEALEHFQSAQSAMRRRPVQLAEFHFYVADTLGHLERWDDAIAAFEAELAMSPRNLKARAGLAKAYAAAARPDDAERTLEDLIKVARTPEGYALAAHAWTTIGQPRRADGLKAEARRLFRGDPTLKFLAQAR